MAVCLTWTHTKFQSDASQEIGALRHHLQVISDETLIYSAATHRIWTRWARNRLHAKPRAVKQLHFFNLINYIMCQLINKQIFIQKRFELRS